MKKKDILIATNAQKVLHFLIEHPIRDFLESEIQKATMVSKAGVNLALRDLVCTDFLSRVKRGKTFFYAINQKNLIVKQLKIIDTITQLNGLMAKLAPLASKIILFGSCGRGENTSDSDIDLLIISHSKERVRAQIKKFKSKREIQPVICSNTEFMEKKNIDIIFYEQVNKGIVLWEGSGHDF